MLVCRLIVDPPADGAWNMALDEALLLSAEQDGVAGLRFYAWQEPTLSLGYFQNHADRRLHCASANCPLVRRASGGGAILHDRELTYSIALPAAHPLSRSAELLYDAAHQSLIETLCDWGIHAALQIDERPLIAGTSNVGGESLRRQTASGQSIGNSVGEGIRLLQPFLCFQRRSPGDLLLGEHKVAGSAQRRHRGAVLQHGSVLWTRSAFAPELPGIFDLSKIPAQKEEEIRVTWQSRLAVRLGIQGEPGPIPQAILTTANEIMRHKFAADAWTYRR